MVVSAVASGLSQSDRDRIGKRLITFAWGVEFIAAGIGLLIAALIIIAARTQISDSIGNTGVTTAGGIMNAFLGGLPFIMVAVVELTKIPLATACYHAATLFWRIVFVVGLLFLMLITFETILNGFERNFTQRTYVINQLRKNLIQAEEGIASIDGEVETLSSVTAESLRTDFDEEMSQIARNAKNELSANDQQITEIRKLYSGREAQVLQDQKDDIEKRLQGVEQRFIKERDRVDSEYGQKSSVRVESLNEQRANLTKQADAIKEQIGASRRAEQEDLARIKDSEHNSSALGAELKRIEADYHQRTEELRTTLENQESSLAAQIAKNRESLQSIIERKSEDIKKETHAFNRAGKTKEIEERYALTISSLQDELDVLQRKAAGLDIAGEIRSLQVSQDAAMQDARREYSNLATSGERQRNEIRNKYATARVPLERQVKEILHRLGNLSADTLLTESSAERDEKLAELRNAYEKERSVLSQTRNDLAQKLAEARAETEDRLLPQLERLQNNGAQLVEKYAALRQTTQDRHALRQEDLKGRERRIVELRDEQSEFQTTRLEIRDHINRRAEDSQIYRVTALWMGKDSPADVNNKELRLVSLVWFGSLAAITAWTGTLLAFAGLAVRYGSEQKSPDGRTLPRRVLRSIRAAFVDIRRRSRRPRIIEKIIEKEIIKPVEVVKEVPVDKVVYRDVPHEVVRKEIVYVPFFSDDPDLLKKTMGQRGNGGTLESQPEETKIDPTPAPIAPSGDVSGERGGK
jgi:hypothetical protein